MIDHVSLAVSDLARSTAFYEPVLATLGMRRLGGGGARVGFGRRYPELWINHRPGLLPLGADGGAHVCLRATTTAAVDAFHATALAHGGHDDGAPGPRRGTMTPYYAAFVRDPDGNRLEAATFPALD